VDSSSLARTGEHRTLALSRCRERKRRQERTLYAVACKRVILIEASPSAYHRGMLALGTSRTHARGGDLRRFSTTPHHCYGGLDRHARALSVCIGSHDGAIVLHRHMPAAPEAFRTAGAPSREGLGVAVDGRFTWSGLAALWAEQGLPGVLGHARSLQALHGGQATHDTIESHKRAAGRRGGMLPQASVSPAPRRATRARRRRRTHLMRPRSALVAPVHPTTSSDNRPELGPKMASPANRAGVAARGSAPAVHKTLGVDRARITPAAARRQALDRSRRTPAPPHAAPTLSR
jgi:hypothetical protein